MPIYGTPALRLNPSFLATTDPAGTGVAAAAITANTIYLYRLPRVTSAMPLSAIEVCIGAAAGNIAAALMATNDPVVTNNDTAAATFARLAHTGEVAASGSGAWQSLALTAGYQYQPNTNVWVAFGGTDAGLTIYRVGSNGNVSRADAIVLSKASAYSSGIPATLTGTTGSGYAPVLKVR